MANVTRIGTVITVQFILPDGASKQVDVELGYRTDDPHAVAMAFRTRNGESKWLVSRDLLAEGLITPTGDGDVRLSPQTDQTALLQLASDDARAVFHVPSSDLQLFLDSTYDVVPLGSESMFLNVDELVQQILN